MVSLSSCLHPAAIVEGIVNKSPDAYSCLLEQYGSRLSFLIQRHCYERSEQFSAAVFAEVMAAVLNHEISADKELPALIQSTFRRLLPQYEEDLSALRAKVLDEIGRTHAAELDQILQEFGILRPIQLRALARFYKDGESVSSICSDLGMTQAEFSHIRKRAWQIVRLALQHSEPIRKGPSRLSQRGDRARVFLTSS